MRKVVLLSFVSGLLALPAHSQTSTTWQRVESMNGQRGHIEEMQIAANGDIVVAGFIPKPGSGSGRAQSDAWVARYSVDGQLIWSKTLGGPLRDEALDLAIAQDGSVLLTGWRDIQEIRSWYAFAAKFQADGELVWEKLIGDGVNRLAANSVVVLDDQSVIIAGGEHPADEAGSRPFIAKFNADGEVAWIQRVAGQPGVEAGGVVAGMAGRRFSFDRAIIGARRGPDRFEILFDRIGISGNFYAGCVVYSFSDATKTDDECAPGALTGHRLGDRYSGGMSASYGESDITISKYRDDGTLEWRRAPQTPMGDGLRAVALTADGGVVGAGFQLNSSKVEFHNWDGLLVRYDTEGNEIWRRVIGGSKRDEFNGVAVLPDGSIVVAGYTGSQSNALEWAPWIMRLNALGELEGDALKSMQERQF